MNWVTLFTGGARQSISSQPLPEDLLNYQWISERLHDKGNRFKGEMISNYQNEAATSVWGEFQKLTPAKASTLFSKEAQVRCIPAGMSAQGQGPIASFLARYFDSMTLRVDEQKISFVETQDKIVEEAVITFVHEREIDWLLPGVRPTNRRLVVPMVTIISFDQEAKISSLHFYWDQASLLRQIGLLPTSLYCKANSSEVVLPVQGIRIADGLIADFEALEVSVTLAESPSSQAKSVAPANQDQSSVEHTRPISGVFPEKDEEWRHKTSRSTAVKSDISSILSGDTSSQYIKPSTRVIQPSGGFSNNIFSNDAPLNLRTGLAMDPKRSTTQTTIFGSNAEEIKHISRRDPNRSSLSYESQSNEDHVRHGTGRKMFSQTASTEDVSYQAPTTGRKMMAGSGASSFSLQHDEYISQQATLNRRDPNARSEENYQRPSSRVLRPPGGGSTLSMG